MCSVSPAGVCWLGQSRHFSLQETGPSGDSMREGGLEALWLHKSIGRVIRHTPLLQSLWAITLGYQLSTLRSCKSGCPFLGWELQPT